MLVAFSVSPPSASGADGSVHDAVAAAVKVVRDSGLPNRTDAMFTTIEGGVGRVHGRGEAGLRGGRRVRARVSLVLKADIRPGHTGGADREG